MESDYIKYRGKCKEFSEALVASNPSLKLIRGYYHCPVWGKQAHWWCVDQDGKVVDPTAKQFPSRGLGEYEEFDGFVECAECGKKIREEKAILTSNYAVCSDRCAMSLVGF